MEKVDFEQFLELASELNLSVLQFSSDLSPLEEARGRLEAWQDQGYAGEMNYMNRSPELLSSPAELFPEAKTLISFALSYSHAPREPLRPGYGRVARYAVHRDYHRELKGRIQKLGEAVSDLPDGPSDLYWKGVTDAFPLLERAFAERAGLGHAGKNTMLIRPKHGSLFFLGEAATSLEFSGAPAPAKESSCGSCTRCLSACPTNAFPEPYVLDATRCISYLTIEKKGPFSDWESKAVGEWLFGCDVCQEVCPFNHALLKRDIPSTIPVRLDHQLELEPILAIRSDEEFKARFAGTPLMRAGREGLQRNARAVLENTVKKE